MASDTPAVENPQIKSSQKVERRSDPIVEKTATRLWHELPSENNPYLAQATQCHGYDLLELMSKRSYADVVYLLFRGELPDKNERELLEKLMIAFINPGPRHPATRAAMNAGVANTLSVHILPIGLNVLGGEHQSAGSIESTMRWLIKSSKQDCKEIAKVSLDCPKDNGTVAPGFGSHFNGIDQMADQIANYLCGLPGAGKVLAWGKSFSQCLNQSNCGWLNIGVVAATLCDLGFQPRMGPGIFQLICAPGIFAHGIELASKPITAMPFLDDKDYFIEDKGN